MSLVAIKHSLNFTAKFTNWRWFRKSQQRLLEGEEENIQGIGMNVILRQEMHRSLWLWSDVCGMDLKKRMVNSVKGLLKFITSTPFHNAVVNEVNPIEDLVPLCWNCHSMIHRTKGELLSIEKLRSLLKKDLLSNHYISYYLYYSRF